MEVASGLSSVMWISNSSNRSVEATAKASSARESTRILPDDAKCTPASSSSAVGYPRHTILDRSW